LGEWGVFVLIFFVAGDKPPCYTRDPSLCLGWLLWGSGDVARCGGVPRKATSCGHVAGKTPRYFSAEIPYHRVTEKLRNKRTEGQGQGLV